MLKFVHALLRALHRRVKDLSLPPSSALSLAHMSGVLHMHAGLSVLRLQQSKEDLIPACMQGLRALCHKKVHVVPLWSRVI